MKTIKRMFLFLIGVCLLTSNIGLPAYAANTSQSTESAYKIVSKETVTIDGEQYVFTTFESEAQTRAAGVISRTMGVSVTVNSHPILTHHKKCTE